MIKLPGKTCDVKKNVVMHKHFIHRFKFNIRGVISCQIRVANVNSINGSVNFEGVNFGLRKRCPGCLISNLKFGFKMMPALFNLGTFVTNFQWFRDRTLKMQFVSWIFWLLAYRVGVFGSDVACKLNSWTAGSFSFIS